MSPACITSGHRYSQRQQCLLHLVLEHRTYFLRVADRILQNEHDAEDTLQNAFYSAWKAVDAFREDAAWKTWFTSIVINKALSMVRAKKLRAAVSIDEDPTCIASFELKQASQLASPEQVLLDGEARQTLHARIAHLPRNTRSVFQMRYYDDLPIDTIASERGTTSRSIQGHLARGKKLLRAPGRRVAQTGRQLAAA